MLPQFTMKAMLDTVVKHRLKELLVVPPILIRLARDPLVDQYDLSCLRRFSTGAAPVSEEILQVLAKKFPQTVFKQAYGMTESCSCITATAPEHYDYKYGHTVGTICRQHRSQSHRSRRQGSRKKQSWRNPYPGASSGHGIPQQCQSHD